MATQPHFNPSQPKAAPAASSRDSVSGLMTRLMDDVTALFRNEVALAKCEFREAAADTKRSVGSILIGGCVAAGGYLALLAAAVLGLATWVAPWLAALIVGVFCSVVGIALIKAAQKKISPESFLMQRTQQAVRKDIAAARSSI